MVAWKIQNFQPFTNVNKPTHLLFNCVWFSQRSTGERNKRWCGLPRVTLNWAGGLDAWMKNLMFFRWRFFGKEAECVATGGICSSEHSGPVPAVGPGPDTERQTLCCFCGQTIFSHAAATESREESINSWGQESCHITWHRFVTGTRKWTFACHRYWD